MCIFRMLEKPLLWLGSSLDDLRAFPETAKREAGHQPLPMKIRRSSGNVFRDLRFSRPAAEHLKMRSSLMIELSKLIQARRLTQAEAAAVFGVTQPRVSDLVRGKIDRFSIDTLVAMLGHAGVPVHIVVGRKSKVA
jgi:predicted XRE-type DNA-binding protein